MNRATSSRYCRKGKHKRPAHLVSGSAIRYVGLDSETQDGQACLLATPEEYSLVGSWADCWRFLASRGPDFCLWNLSYDARAILAYLPGTVLARLRRACIADYHSWHIEYKARKSLKVSRGSERVYFWDVYPYYECSLDKAAGKYLDGDHKDDIPKAWLPKMAWALTHHRERVVRYCMRDASLTQRLSEICEEQYTQLGVSYHRAASPATLAVRAFPKSYDFKSLPGYVQTVFRRSYYGGRAEVFQRGNVGRAYCYDIHSAYPSVLTRLLDPRLCTEVKARPGKPPRADAAYGSYHVYVEIPPTEHICPLPYRSTGLPLIYPSGAFTSWIDRESLLMLLEHGYRTRVLEGIELLVDSEKLLFPDLERWYRMRRECPAMSLAIKKTLNSVYGKLAELRPVRVEVKGRKLPRDATYYKGKWTRRIKIPTPHTHFAVASAVTAGCRRKLFDAMKAAGSSIIACHTDGIVSKRRLPLALGDGLGEWGLEHEPDEAIVIGVGIYLYRKAAEYVEKTRGLHLSRPLRDILKEKLSRVELWIRHAYTMADAERVGWKHLNEMVQVRKVVDANMDRKRAWTRPWQSFAELASHKQRSRSLIVVDKWALRHGKKKRTKRRAGGSGTRCAGG